jgi:GNAT superfamily N-acetyltransferase
MTEFVQSVHRAPHRFGPGYEEVVRLQNGANARLRLVRPEDRELLRRGFERLSPESRYRRFHAVRASLTDAELGYLTELDGHDHFALGAVRELEPGREEGLGVARFVRSASDPSLAEAAIAVIDDWQRCGLGRVLFDRLVLAARERGIERFAADVLPENEGFLSLVQRLSAYVMEDYEDVLHLEIALGEPAPRSPLYELFTAVARRSARVRLPSFKR